MKKALAIVVIFIAFFSCKTQQGIRLKDLYEKIADEALGNNHYDTTKSPTLALTKKKEEKKEEEKKKVKQRVFYGFKTKRAYARKGEGKKREWELFYVLKKPVAPNPYVKDFYWYHRKKRKIIMGPIEEADKPYARILHGPYLRRQGKILIEEGIFYVGTKHGRWAKYDRNFILMDKKRFYKGWPTDAEISYYDNDRKQPKEVIPIQLGRKEGSYYYFAPDGTVLTTGQFKDDVKIGVWTEYYANKRKKKEIQFNRDSYSDFKPFVIKEYDNKGKVTYDFRKDGAKEDSTLVSK